MKKGIWGLACLLALAALLLLMPMGALAQESRAVTGEAQLVAGEVYWFDLSSMKRVWYTGHPPGDLQLVPAVYTGTMYAYVLNKESVGNAGSSSAASNTTDPPGEYGYIYNHSLFVTTVGVTRSWNAMNEENLIFGREYTNNGVTYTMRAPTGGSAPLGTAGSPSENEFASFQKYLAKISKSNFAILMQDTYVKDSSESVSRTSLTAEFRAFSRNSSEAGSYMPVLEPQSGALSVHLQPQRRPVSDRLGFDGGEMMAMSPISNWCGMPIPPSARWIWALTPTRISSPLPLRRLRAGWATTGTPTRRANPSPKT